MEKSKETFMNYGTDFQDKVAQLMLEDRPFCDQIEEILEKDDDLRKAYESKMEEDLDFRKSERAQLYFIYKGSPYFEKTVNILPVFFQY